MAKLGVVSDEQFEREKVDCVLEGTVEPLARGRHMGDVNVPQEIRKLIADDHLANGRESAVELARDFGISSSSVSAYAKGATSTATYHEPNKDLTNYLASRKKRITKKSLTVLQSALQEITPDKLSTLSPTKLATVAKDMSVISKNMEPKTEQGQGDNKPQFVIYAPTVKEEKNYETVIVTDGF